MRLTQGTFSYLPDLTDQQISSQIEYCLQRGWAVSVEHTEDPHPRNTYWEMYGNPMFDLKDAAGIMREVEDCRRTFANRYIKVNAFDASRGVESLRLSFLVARPLEEPGFELLREEGPGREVRYSMRSYATRRPEGHRY
jgi:ribulose-bisphosphate carboxylase small chain